MYKLRGIDLSGLDGHRGDMRVGSVSSGVSSISVSGSGNLGGVGVSGSLSISHLGTEIERKLKLDFNI